MFFKVFYSEGDSPHPHEYEYGSPRYDGLLKITETKTGRCSE